MSDHYYHVSPDLRNTVPYVVPDVPEVGIPVILDHGHLFRQSELRGGLLAGTAEPIVNDAGLLFRIELGEGQTRRAILVNVHVTSKRCNLAGNRFTDEARQERSIFDLPGVSELMDE